MTTELLEMRVLLKVSHREKYYCAIRSIALHVIYHY